MWWTPLISSGIGAVQAITGANQASKAREEAEALTQKQNEENEADYANEYYVDYTKRADSQNILKRLKETTDSRKKQDEMTAAITGATPESVQVAENANNKIISDTYGNLAAMGANYKTHVKDRYLNRKDIITGQRYKTLQEKAMSGENAMYNGISAIGSGVAGALGNLPDGGAGGATASNLNKGTEVKYDYTEPTKNMYDLDKPLIS